ncbi:MAG TPA: hypothetical protein VEB66_06830 [Opitutaceae bacterium]|nr:hypothetical protein [Opitutaceae bacterium]
MDKPWKIILLLAGIFATGATTGALVAVRVCKDKLEKPKSPPPMEQWAPERLKRLKERLKLTPEQVEKLKPVMRRDMEELGQIRGTFFGESRRVIERMERDIAAELTPAQRQEYEKVKQESAERWRKMMQERERSGKPRGPEHDGPRRPADGKPGEPAPPPGGGE